MSMIRSVTRHWFVYLRSSSFADGGTAEYGLSGDKVHADQPQSLDIRDVSARVTSISPCFSAIGNSCLYFSCWEQRFIEHKYRRKN